MSVYRNKTLQLIYHVSIFSFLFLFINSVHVKLSIRFPRIFFPYLFSMEKSRPYNSKYTDWRIFYRFFEIEAVFPRDCTMIVQVWDYDATTADDLIGETKIDIESRFYSKHRATCGISKLYASEGYNEWRDREKPTQILEQLCKRNNLPLPEYRNRYVKIGRKKFPFDETEHPESGAF